jgi:hypothetical protein
MKIPLDGNVNKAGEETMKDNYQQAPEKVEKPKESAKADQAEIKESHEAQNSMELLVKEQRHQLHLLKEGEHSGITHQFGKPTIEDKGAYR